MMYNEIGYITSTLSLQHLVLRIQYWINCYGYIVLTNHQYHVMTFFFQVYIAKYFPNGWMQCCITCAILLGHTSTGKIRR